MMDKKVKVLYLSYDGMTDPLGQSQVLPYLAGLSAVGYEFHLVSFEKPHLFEKHRQTIQQICDKNNIFWYPKKYTKSPPVLSTMKDVRVMKKTSKEIVRKEKIQLVHARGHYITSIVALQMKQQFGVKYVFDMRGFWADERVDGKLWNPNKFPYSKLFKFFKDREKTFLQQTDHIITLTQAAERIIRQWQKENQWKSVPVSVIPCCADLDLFDYNNYTSKDRKAMRGQLGIPEDANVICYLGSIGTWYMLEEMLRFYGQLNEHNDIYFLFVTPESKDGILAEAEKLGVNASKIKVVSATRKEVPAYLYAADFSLFFITPAFSKQGSSPVKHGECLGMGLPVISNTGVGDMELITETTQSGICIDPEQTVDPQLRRQVLELKHLDKTKIRDAAFKYYDLQDGIRKYSDIYKKIGV